MNMSASNPVTQAVASGALFRTAVCFALLTFGTLALAAEDTKTETNEAVAKKNFATDYDAGVAAVTEKNWVLARQKMTTALKSLGDFSDVKKSTAQVLLLKAERALIKDDALFTASELMRLKQWVEAEEAFRKVVEVSGETETIRKNVMACRAGLEAESNDLRTAGELLKDRKWKDATAAYNKASDKLGGIRMIRDGLTTAQLGAESDELLKKGPQYLKDKKWEDAFNVYKRLTQILGETDEVKKGIADAQEGYKKDHEGSAPPAEPLGPKQ
ncbi:MAG: hypothetical protein WCT04_23380 [Planctomycetota bacterium]